MGSGWTGGSGISEPVDLTQELTVSTGELASDVANGAQAVGFTLDTNNSLSTSGAKLLSLRNNSTEKAYFDKDGALYVGGQRVAISTYSVVTDLDFTAEATQTITSDTTWTIGGLTWRSLNYAAASTFAVTSGTGLQIGSTTSKTWDNTGRSAAVFYLQLSDLSASITARTPLRLWLHLPTFTLNGASDAAIVALCNVGSGSVSTHTALGAQRMCYAGAASGWCQVSRMSGLSDGSHAASSDTAGQASYNVVMVEFPSGYGAGQGFASIGVWSSGWPADTTLVPLGPVGGLNYRPMWPGAAPTWNIALSATRGAVAGTHLAVFANLKVEAKL